LRKRAWWRTSGCAQAIPIARTYPGIFRSDITSFRQ
jgi:hypothetical protein